MHVEDKDLTGALSDQTGGEPLGAAVYARMETAVSPARWLGPLGNYLIVRPAARAAAHHETEKTALPLDAAVVLGVAGDQLHVWSADPMLSLVTDHLGSLALERISGMSATEPGKWWKLKLDFPGEEPLELSARGDVPGLVAAYERGRPAAAQ